MKIEQGNQPAQNMSQKSIFVEYSIRIGWISIIMCLPFYVIHAFFLFDLKWMTGLPFSFFYFWSLVNALLLLPILIVLQCGVIITIWIKQKTIPLPQVILFLASTGLYVFATPGLWRGLLSS